MKVSVCITVLNEDETISELLEALLTQSKKADEIVIVDGGSIDKTVGIIRHLQKKDKRIKLLVERCGRARGRNLAVDLAKNEIIAMTDAGCVPERNWLFAITKPFRVEEIDIVAGFYNMKALNSLQKAFSVFLGTSPRDFNIDFLPSTRSIAFRKKSWEKIGGFPENLDTAEDTVFNYKALKLGLNFARVENARVEWRVPATFKEFFKKIFAYAKGDAKSGIWFYPSESLRSHNIKAISVYTRYLIFIIFMIYSFFKPSLAGLFLLFVVFYSLWSFRKVFLKTNDLIAGFCGIFVQFVSDFAVMSGFLKGLFS